MLEQINQISEQAFLLDFGTDIDIKTNNYVLSFAERIFKEIEKDNYLEIKNCVPSYNKILIQFNPSSTKKLKILDFLHSIDIKKIITDKDKKIVEMPICYDDEFALDIDDIAAKKQIKKADIIDLHVSTKFYVYMIGFMPGLPFMGNLDERLSVPRKATPRIHVPAGSVGIVDNLCVIYPDNSPGGWNIIGRTPQRLFFKEKNNPNLLNPGYFLKFKPISKKQFREMDPINE